MAKQKRLEAAERDLKEREVSATTRRDVEEIERVRRDKDREFEDFLSEVKDFLCTIGDGTTPGYYGVDFSSDEEEASAVKYGIQVQQFYFPLRILFKIRSIFFIFDMFSLAFDIGAFYTTTHVRRPKPSLYDRRPRRRERVPVHTGGDVASRMEQLQRSVEEGGGGRDTGGGPWNIGKVDTGFLEQDEEQVEQ